MYTLSGCMWCGSARRRLRRRGIDFEEVDAESIADFREFLLSTTGGSTVPQILIDGIAIGGADDLARLDRSGALLPRVQRERFPLVVNKRRLGILGWHHHIRVIDEDGEVLESVRVRSQTASEDFADELAAKHPAQVQSPDSAGTE